MARQPIVPKLFSPETGASYRFPQAVADQLSLRMAADFISPEVTALQTLDDPDEAIRLAAHHLAQQHSLPLQQVQSCFDRVVAQAYPNGLPHGLILAQAFAIGPLSLPRRAMVCTAVERPLEFCAKEDAATFPVRSLVAQILADICTPLYTLPELSKVIAAFSAHQESNRDDLVNIGHPRTVFTANPWFDVWLNKLYPVKIPIGDLKATTPRGAYHHRYVDKRRVAIPATKQPHWRPSTKGLWPSERSPSPAARTIHFVWGQWRKLGGVRECKYHRASLVTGLATDAAEWLASMRPHIQSLKLQLLQELRTAVAANDAKGLGERCLNVLGRTLLDEQIKRLLRYDRTYLGYNVLSGSEQSDTVPCIPGGLTNILEVAGYIEKELLIGTLSQTRAALGDLVVRDALGRPTLNCDATHELYLRLAAGPHREPWCKAVDLYLELEDQEDSFWVNYRMRLGQAMGEGVQAAAVIPVKRKHRPVLEPLLRANADEITRKLESGELVPSQLATRLAKTPTATFPMIDGLRWEEVTIAFISPQQVQISARRRRIILDFKKMGFEDRRTGTSDSRWALLRKLAELKGRLDWNSKVEQGVRNRVKAAVKEIRDRLQAVLQIADDPFEDYKAVKAYQTKFTLRKDFVADPEDTGNDDAPTTPN